MRFPVICEEAQARSDESNENLAEGKVFRTFEPTRAIAVHQSDAWMTCRSTTENKMEISLEEHVKPDFWNYPTWEDNIEDEHSNFVRCSCTCDLWRAAHVGATHLGEESSLIGVVKLEHSLSDTTANSEPPLVQHANVRSWAE